MVGHQRRDCAVPDVHGDDSQVDSDDDSSDDEHSDDVEVVVMDLLMAADS